MDLLIGVVELKIFVQAPGGGLIVDNNVDFILFDRCYFCQSIPGIIVLPFVW